MITENSTGLEYETHAQLVARIETLRAANLQLQGLVERTAKQLADMEKENNSLKRRLER